MTDLEQQLAVEHKQVVNKFAGSPYIDISFSDGDPPRKYEILYKIKGGVRREDGSVELTEGHRVAILIPFGYPNFPPNCKPLTTVFHPDFDPAAIRVSDFWSVFKSLPALITHVGRMISGQVYCTDNAFNPEAARWYQENGNRLPFDSVNLEKGSDDLGLEIFEDLGMPSAETPDELSLSLEEADLPPPEEVERIIGAQMVLEPGGFGGRKGEKKEVLGRDIDGEVEISGGGGDSSTAQRGKGKLKDKHSDPSPELVDTPSDGQEGLLTDLSAAYAREQRIRYLKRVRISAVLGVVVFVVGGSFLLVMDIINYNKAEDVWNGAARLLEEKRYQEVKDLGETALEEIGGIRFLRKDLAVGLKKEIEELFKNEEFQSGVAGKILYEGAYVKQDSVPIRQKIQTAIQNGDKATIGGRWEEAVTFYKEAKALVENNKIDVKEISEAIEGSLEKTRLRHLVEEGGAYLNAERFDDAVATFQKAAEIVNSDADEDPEITALIHKSLDRALLQKFIKVGEGAFTAIQLGKALNSFQQALLLAEKETSLVPEYADGIRKSIQQIKLYQLLETGKTEYEALRWEEALKSFTEALRFIKDESLGHAEMAAHEPAIREKILQISVQIAEKNAESYKSEGKTDAAMREYQRIIDLVKASPLKGDAGFAALAARAKKEIKTLKSEIDVEAKMQYLLDNYQEIFQANHSLAKAATLRYPEVAFIQQEGQGQLFNLKCTGFTTTGKISLELNYLFDGRTKTWSMANRR